MKISINQIFFIVFLITNLFGNENIQLGANLLVFILFLIQGKIYKRIGNLLFLLFIPVLLALITGVFVFPLYDVFRDIYYLLNPILFIIAGLFFAKSINDKVLLKTILWVGSIYSVIHILKVITEIGFVAFTDIRGIRNYVGGGNVIIPVALLLTIISKSIFKLNLFKTKIAFLFCLGINSISFILTGSRTFIMIFLIYLFIAVLIKYQHQKLIIIRTGIILTFIIAFLIYIGKDNSLVNSMLNSLNEISIGDYSDIEDQNDKYRGWETYQAFQTYKNGNIPQLIFGHGAGKMIDLETHFYLANEYRRYIPILHNGYLYILVKTGIIGSIFYFLFLIKVLRFKNRNYAYEFNFKIYRFLLLGSIISMYVANLVISGLFNPGMEIVGLMCGAMLYYISNHKLTKV